MTDKSSDLASSHAEKIRTWNEFKAARDTTAKAQAEKAYRQALRTHCETAPEALAADYRLAAAKLPQSQLKLAEFEAKDVALAHEGTLLDAELKKRREEADLTGRRVRRVVIAPLRAVLDDELKAAESCVEELRELAEALARKRASLAEERAAIASRIAALEADLESILALAESRIGWLAGSLEEIESQVTNPRCTIDLNALARLLSQWRAGIHVGRQAADHSPLPTEHYVIRRARVFYLQATGELVKSVIHEADDEKGNPWHGAEPEQATSWHGWSPKKPFDLGKTMSELDAWLRAEGR